MEGADVYVVRIYRRDGAGAAGIVESVASGECRGFHDASSLWEGLLRAPARRGDVSDGSPTGEVP